MFTLAVSAFVTPSLIGGPRVPVMSTLIYQQGMSLLNWPFGAAIGFTMLATILALFMLTSALAPAGARRVILLGRQHAHRAVSAGAGARGRRDQRRPRPPIPCSRRTASRFDGSSTF